MEDIVAKYFLAFVCVSVVCVMLLAAIFTAVVIIAQNSQKQEQKQTDRVEQHVRIALCVNCPDPSITSEVRNWFTVGKVYMIKSGHVVDDQGYEWTTFAHRIRKGPHTNECAGYSFYIV